MVALARRTAFGFGNGRNVPIGPIEVDWSHPLASSLVISHVGSQFPRMLGRPDLAPLTTTAGSWVTQIGPYGLGLTPATGSFPKYDTSLLPVSTDYTVFAFQSLPGGITGTGLSASPIGGDGLPSSTKRSFQLNLTTARVPQVVFFNAAAGTLIPTAAALTTDQCTQGWTQSMKLGMADGKGYLTVNGLTALGGTLTGTPTAFGGTSSVVLGGNGNGGSNNFYGNGTVYAGYVWTRKISDGEDAWLDAEPFAFFRPVVRRRVYLPGSAGAVLASPGAGNLTFAGYTPTILANVSLAAGVGSLALTGQAPTVSAGAGATPGTGALAITGQQPTVSATVSVTPGAGALALAGQQPAVSTGASVAPGTGSLALSGQSPAVQAGTTAAPGAGNLAFTGLAPSVIAGVSTAPGTGALTFAGQAPSASAGASAVPGAGALTFTGQTPSLSLGGSLAITPNAGALTFAGQQPTIRADASVTPGAGAITFTGRQVTVAANIAAVPGAGALAFTGLAPSVRADASATPGAAVVAFVGGQPSVNVSFAATPGAGLIALTGYAPTVQGDTPDVAPPSVIDVGHVAMFATDARLATLPVDSRTVTLSGTA